MPATMPLLEVTDLDKTFMVDSRSVTAIDHLSLSIDEHEFVSIVGPSGCGKSTFLHIIGGFEPATAGELRLSGRPIGPPGPDRGMMFQELSLFPWLTAIENVAWPLEMAHRQGGRISRSRSSVPFRRSLSRSTQRRDETARQLGTVVCARSGNHAEGRAVRRARFPDSGIAAGGAAVDLATRPQDRAVRHPRHRRGDLSGNASDRVYGASRPRQGRHPPSQP